MHGEPGIGKSALARAFADGAEAAGMRVAWGAAWEAGGAPPLWPWVEVLREALREGTSAIEPSALAEIAELVPELGASPTSAVDGDPAARRFRRFDAIARVLRHSAAERPLAIVLDDLHAADLPTLELLQLVAQGVRAQPIAILGTHRDAEPRLDAATGAALARVRRHATSIALARLDREAVRELATQWRFDASEPLVDELIRATEGNPLFVIESLRLRRSGAQAGAPVEGALALLRERLARLPQVTRAVLEIGAALGREVDVAIVARAAAMAIDDVRSALRIAIAADVLVARDEDRVAFTHVLLRDAVYGAIDEPKRAAIHTWVGEAIEGASRLDPRTRIVGLASHFIAGIAVAGPERAVRYACQAAERAVELNAHEAAVAILERCGTALDATGAADGLRIDALLALGLTHIRGGEPARGREVCLRAVELARKSSDADRFAEAALVVGEHFAFAVVDPVLVALLEEALAKLGPATTPLRARVLGRLAAAQQPAVEPRGPMALAREAIASVREVGDAPTRLAVLTSAGSALLYFADPRERIPINREIVEIATVLGDQVRRTRGELRLVFDMIELGDTVAAGTHIESYVRIAGTLAVPIYGWTSRMVRALQATMRGRFADAERLAAEAIALGPSLDDTNVRIGTLGQRAGLLITATRWDELAAIEGELARAMLGTTDANYARPCLLAVAAKLGRIDEARRGLAAFASRLDEQRDRTGVAWLADVCVLVEDRELAPVLLELLRPFAHRWLVWGLAAMACEGPLTEPMGRLARLLGRHDDAITWLDDARSRCEAADATPHLARVLVELAGALRDRGGDGDEARAKEHCTRARTLADTLGMPGLAARIDEPFTVASVPDGVAFRMVKDGEVWALHVGESTLRLKDSRGLQILAKLVDAPERSLHVFELLGPDDGERDRGDAGEALDARAIQQYRARAEALRDAMEDASSIGDSEKVERCRDELERIGAELARGVGLGGRARREGSAIERARVNVRRRLTDAIGRIAAQHAELGRHLEWAVKTGVFCSYHPTGPRRLSAAPRGSG